MGDVSQAATCVVIVADEVEMWSVHADDAPAPRGETAIVPTDEGLCDQASRSLPVSDDKDDKPAESGRWEQLNKCPECGEDMRRELAVGERIGLFYRCPTHGRFRYSWDHDRLEPD